MKILIMSDSYKGTATNVEVARSIKKGVLRADPSSRVRIQAMADGGEGTTEVLAEALGATYKLVSVKGPLGEIHQARIAYQGDTWIIEMAQASGLHLVPWNRRNPLVTSTYGTGELLRHALDHGAKTIYMGLGGSATNDAGAGAFVALGGKLYDRHHRYLKPGGWSLRHLKSMDSTGLHPRLAEVELIILSDVESPLCGDTGATKVFGPQKGLFKERIEDLDAALANYGRVLEQTFSCQVMDQPGSGAAGGLGATLFALFSHQVASGVETILDLTGADELIKEADLIITGEGRLDAQSLKGKTPIGVARRAKRYHKPCIAIVGSCAFELQGIYEAGVDLVIDLSHQSSTKGYLIKHMHPLLERAGEMAMRAAMLGRTL